MTNFLHAFAVAFVLAGAVQAIRFVKVYSSPPFDWRTYEAGRHLMRFTFGIALILTWSLAVFVLRIWFEDDRWFQLTVQVGRIFIFGYIAWMMHARLKLLLRSRQTDDPNRKEV